MAGFLARHLGNPVRWIEDRRESLTGNANCREHHYELTAYANRDGRLLALDCDATVDAGAYSIYPFSACLEAAQVASILPGPYDFRASRCTTWSVATNKPPILPYRGVARSGVAYGMETVMDAIAEATGLEPDVVRLRNLVLAEAMPFDNITNKHFDSGDYPKALRRAVKAIDLPGVRAQQAMEHGPMRTGVGLAIFCEQGRTAPPSMPDGVSRWCRAGSRPRHRSRRMAGWNCASACSRMARGWRRHWRRWRTRCWRYPSRACGSCTGIRR